MVLLQDHLQLETYYVLKYGMINHQEYTDKQFDVIEVERLIGKLCFWKYLEPDNTFVQAHLPLLKEYSKQLDKMLVP